ncbi:tRNA (adenosine(37)-N6)-dimethylallyltransferase MiaA [Geofilum rubicundum]|uniref:tRNA dimethylallyltransferase n=1 Tax=Geofilum rubicundum JCM 15548 TaxID=1236989 RepID=A0A0E9LWP6_9BACT|nr:tRNA (adenosine(37)-N6)-dimethylallyltransferase MiaA [Geofilum rubicundum]GAO29541.1 tRNA delta(2)-isopentenylpyrophosphate transferase [Geofilum rubicundum JCM 15548]
MTKTMVVIAGPTGVGKTKTGIELARAYNSEIISADSRQIYKEIPIGTAAPTQEERAGVLHHLMGTHSVFDDYNAFEFEQDALALTETFFQKRDVLFMVGGSMMYMDAYCHGIDELPSIDPQLRLDLMEQLETDGLEALRLQLKQLDPVFYTQVDLKNPKRVIHALEICLMTGQPYSLLRTNPRKERPFKIIRIGLNRDRAELYDRINDRVLEMMGKGLEQEARALIDHQHLNALNTVGFKELFACYNGEYDLDRAIELIQRNSRHYAKKQLSWFNRNPEIHWFHPSAIHDMLELIERESGALVHK